MSTTFEAVEIEKLTRVYGGAMNADARWIMMHESGGNPRARNAHSSAFGAFQMIKANRKALMGADWQSTDLNKQYAAATKYVNQRYGGWHNARSFWQRHHWY